MKRISLLLTTILVAACSSEGRKANLSEQQAATGFVHSALSISGSFDAQNAMPELPVAFGIMPAGDASCVTRVGDRLSFNCSEDSVTITGTLTREGDHVTMDLHASGRISMDFSGDFTINATEINGTLALRIVADQISLRANAAYDHVKLDAARCPISGRLRFDAEATANGRTQSRDLEVGFGPACGDVTVFD